MKPLQDQHDEQNISLANIWSVPGAEVRALSVLILFRGVFNEQIDWTFDPSDQRPYAQEESNPNSEH